jgi:hypothetical protein
MLVIQKKMFGYVLGHDDSDSHQHGSNFDKTAALWEKEFQTPIHQTERNNQIK